MTTDRGDSKKQGARAAKEWYTQATIEQRVALAGCDFEYGETPSKLVADGYDVPKSEDMDYSWGFFKEVKGIVFHAIHAADDRRRKGSKKDEDS